MKLIRNAFDSVAPHFGPGGKWHKLHALYEMPDTIFFTPPDVTRTGSHVRDAINLKRMMITVVIALQPVFAFATWNTGFQANRAIAGGAKPLDDFNTAIFNALGFSHDPDSFLANMALGLCYFLPVFLVTQAAGGIVEVITALVRKHEVNEGFLVTGSLFPLILPPTIPLWQVALGIMFGVLIGKEVFGGTGMNVLNPALVARAFLFFAYPAQISGDKVWTAVQSDGFSGATWLAKAKESTEAFAGASWWDAFIGTVPGSMGETSALACLLGAGLLIATRVGAWQTMLGVTVGTAVMATIFNGIGSDTNVILVAGPSAWSSWPRTRSPRPSPPRAS
jgi:Na+-transporting NADH:ubiquinone oxidoreductase subunit B